MKNLSLFLSLTTLSVFAQQESVMSMYWNVNEYYNPAATGMEYKHKAILQYRNQWTGVNGAPTSVVGTYGTKVEKLNGGLGVNGVYETIGFNKIIKANANYSYHIKFGESVLGIGGQAGFGNVRFSKSFNPPVTYDDPTLPASSSTDFNGALGLFYKVRKFTVGLSATQLGSEKKSNHYDPVIHYWATMAYELNVTENFQLNPSFLYVTETHYGNLNFNLRATVYQNIWVGASFRNRDAYSFIAGYDLGGKFRIGYCYENSVSRLNNGISFGTHEAVLGFLLK